MIGPRVGLQVGVRVGLAVGVSEDESGSGGGGGAMAAVTRDSTSNVYAPSSAAEWTVTLAAAGILSGNPSALYLLQEASGNPADTIGAFPLTVENAAGISYQNAVTGWTRKALNTTSGTAGLVRTTSASLPDLSTTSHLLLGYAKNTTIAATRDILLMGATATRMMVDALLTSGFARGRCVGNVASGAADAGGVVRPWVLQLNRTAGSCALYTDAEKIVPAFGATAAGQSIAFGNLVGGCATCQYLYLASFHAGAAELTAAQVKSLLQVLGWTVPWS